MRIKLCIIIFSVLFQCCTAEESVEPVFKNATLVVRKVCDLPAETHENSGIIFYQGLLWTFNDSGNEATLYAVDTSSGKLVRKINLTGAENVDWEAIDQDDSYIYIADIGNNYQARDVYYLYIIAKDSISNSSEQTIKPSVKQKITFQENELSKIGFNKASVNSEAILVNEESVFVYTKDTLMANVSSFVTSTFSNDSILSLKGTFEVGYAVTAATRIDEEHIAFLGYKDYRIYLTILESPLQLIGAKKAAHYELSELFGCQTEGLSYVNGKFYISCEASLITQALFCAEFKSE